MDHITEMQVADLAPDVAELALLLKRLSEGDLQAEQAVCHRAATGSVDYQRVILDAILEEGGLSTESLVRSEILARFVASHGIVEDRLVLASICHMLADNFAKMEAIENSNYYAGEAALALICASDQGSGVAAETLAKLVADYPAAMEVVDLAGKAAPAGDPVPLDALAYEPPPLVRTVTPPSRWVMVKFHSANLWTAICGLCRAVVGRS